MWPEVRSGYPVSQRDHGGLIEGQLRSLAMWTGGFPAADTQRGPSSQEQAFLENLGDSDWF